MKKADNLQQCVKKNKGKNKPIKCQVCDKVYRCESQQRQHAASHVTNNHLSEKCCTIPRGCVDGSSEPIQKRKDATNVCPVCGVRIPDRRKLKSHIRSCVPAVTSQTRDEHTDLEIATILEPSKSQKTCITLTAKTKDKHKKVQKIIKESDEELDLLTSKTCTVCHKVFARSANVQLHMRLHRGEKPFTCSTCGKTFRRSDHLKNHELIHVRKEPYQCSLCKDTFKRKDHLKYHQINNHGAKIYLNEVKSYTRTASQVQNRVILCDVCGVSFGSEKNLKNHLRIHSNQGKFSCQYCGKTFNQSSNLNIHLRKHTGETPYRCFNCDLSFTTSSKLKTHARKHTGDLPFTCPICERRFGENHLLKMHMRIHGSQKSYTCSHCDKTFTHSSTLRAHIRTHTGVKPYKCDQCPNTFAQISSLTYHKRTHSGEKPYSCHICGNSYTRMATLNIHLTRHTGQKRVHCPHCDFKCDTPKHLRKHMTSVHNQSLSSVDLFLKQNPNQESGTLHEDCVNSSPTDPPISHPVQSMDLYSTVTQSQGKQTYASSTWNSDHPVNKPGQLTDNSVTSHHANQALNITQTKLMSTDTSNMYNLSSTQYVYGLIVGFSAGPKYADVGILTPASVDSTSLQTMPAPSYFPQLHSSTPGVGCSQHGNNAEFCRTTSTLPQENTLSSTRVIGNGVPQEMTPFSTSMTVNNLPQDTTLSSTQINACTHASFPYQGQMTSLPNSTCSQDVQPSSPKENVSSRQSLAPTVPDNQHVLVAQQSHQSDLTKAMLTADVSEIYMTTSSCTQPSEDGTRNQLLEQKFSFQEESCDNLDKNENMVTQGVVLEEGTFGRIKKAPVKGIFEVIKVDVEDDGEEDKTNAGNEEIDSACSSQSKKTIRLKSSAVCQSRPGKSNYRRASKFYKSTSSEHDKAKKVHTCKLRSQTDSKLQRTDSAKLVQRHKGPVGCEVCGQTFSRTGNLTTHMRLHSGERPYSCKICGKCYTRSDHLKSHMLLHQGDNSLICNHCGDVFSTTDQLSLHTADRHEGKKPFACNLCTFSCIYLRELKDHIKNHEGKDSFHCGLCRIFFLKAKDLKSHMKSHVGQSPFTCHTCEKSFKESSCLKLHMRTKHTGEKNFKCGICEESYVTAAKLQRHMQNHSGARPFACEYCGKMFIDTCLLKMHVRIHTNEKPFKCKYCGQNFTHRSTLRAHVRIHTGTKPYTCEVCGASFVQVSSLTYHKRRHDGVKPYTCHICGNCYTRSTTLNIHMTRHTGQKRVACPHCAFKCDMLKHLRRHLAKVHNLAEQVKGHRHRANHEEQSHKGQLKHEQQSGGHGHVEPQVQVQRQQLQPLHEPQILLLPQHQFQQGIMMAETSHQPQSLMVNELQSQAHPHVLHQPTQHLQPSPQPLGSYQTIYKTTADTFSVITAGSTDFVRRNATFNPSTTTHTF